MTAAKPKTIAEMEERLVTLYRRRQKAEQRLKKSTAEMRALQRKIRELEEEKFTRQCRDFGVRLAKANLSPGQVDMEKLAQMVASNRSEYARPADSPLPENPLNPKDQDEQPREDGREAE
jgi:predicted nuclease with TOPRIM domain